MPSLFKISAIAAAVFTLQLSEISRRETDCGSRTMAANPLLGSHSTAKGFSLGRKSSRFGGRTVGRNAVVHESPIVPVLEQRAGQSYHCANAHVVGRAQGRARFRLQEGRRQRSDAA